MFRSDNLYSEMNYMIENLSKDLLEQSLVLSSILLFLELYQYGFPKHVKQRNHLDTIEYNKLSITHNRVNIELRGTT